MEIETFEKIDGENFSVVNVGKLEDLGAFTFNNPALPGPMSGKLFLKNELKLTGMEISLNKLPVGAEMPFSHKHIENEELYLFIKGRGRFLVDGQAFDVREGTAIRVAPQGVRTWKNVSTDDLFYIIIQAKENSLKKEDIADGVPVSREVIWPEPL